MRLLRKLAKVTLIAIASIVLLTLLAIGYISLFLPRVTPAPNLKVEITSERVKRGEYLANHVMACMSCHASRNWSVLGAPMIPGTEGKGGDKLEQDSLGSFGDIYFSNITPANLGGWTDGEIYRLITTGIKKDGQPITGIMPYEFFGRADPEDLKAVIAYLRTLKPMYNKVPQSTTPFWIRLVNRIGHHEPQPEQRPAEKDTIAYGRYLTRQAMCIVCHSPFTGFGIDESHAFSGGFTFTLPSGRVTPVNLTPDNETGIGKWTREDFLGRFKRFRDSTNFQHIDPKKDFNSLMPWPFFAGMTDNDLSAIYAYLRTLKPEHHKVDRFVPLTEIYNKTN